MSSRTIFRFSVIGVLVFEIAIYVALYFFDDGAFDPSWDLLPESVDFYTYFDSHFAISIIASFLIIAVIISSIVGVLLLRNWGRWLYLAVSG